MNEIIDHNRHNRIKILVLAGYYYPAYKAGGPVRTIHGIIDQLGTNFDFSIIAYDRDFGEKTALQGIHVNQWQRIGNANLYFASPEQFTVISFLKMLNELQYDILYINSFFSFQLSILPLLLRRFRLIKKRAVILAPRGEFSPGAINLKHTKKRCFLWFAKLLKLHSSIRFQASSTLEAEHIQQWISCDKNINYKGSNISVATDLTAISPFSAPEWNSLKIQGLLRIVFLSRISPMKNLDYALKIVCQLKGNVVFDIYGPIHRNRDANYWTNCQRLIESMPSSLRVNYHGAIQPTQVRVVISQYDVFFLPTRGENFGHVILEALSVGCPVLISDKTPWRNLIAKQAGWDLPLEQPKTFIEVLEQLQAMNAQQHSVFSEGALRLAINSINSPESVEQNRNLFLQAFSHSQSNFH